MLARRSAPEYGVTLTRLSCPANERPGDVLPASIDSDSILVLPTVARTVSVFCTAFLPTLTSSVTRAF